MNTQCRKRGAVSPLEKPLVPRLAFKRERVVGDQLLALPLPSGVAPSTSLLFGTPAYSTRDSFTDDLALPAFSAKRQKLSSAGCDTMDGRPDATEREVAGFAQGGNGEGRKVGSHEKVGCKADTAVSSPWGSGGWLGVNRPSKGVQSRCCSETSVVNKNGASPGELTCDAARVCVFAARWVFAPYACIYFMAQTAHIQIPRFPLTIYHLVLNGHY